MGLLPPDIAGMLVGSTPSTSWRFALAVFVCLVLLDAFDVPLPRGDSIGVGGALCAAALLVLGPFSAVLLSLAAIVPAYLIRRRVRSATKVVGRLVARSTALVAAIVLLTILQGAGAIWSVPVAVLSVPAVFLLSELIAGQIVSAGRGSREFRRLLLGNLRTQVPLLAAQWSGAVLLLLIYKGMGYWSLIPVVALLLLMQQSYAMLLDIRETYRTTVEVLVEAAESQDERRIGHAERSAVIARSIGGSLGLSAPQLELLSYTALLHDIDAIRVDSQQDTDSGMAQDCSSFRGSSDVIRGVDFFADVLPILEVCDGRKTEANYNQKLAALVVAVASDIDAADHEAVAAAHHTGAVEIVAPLVPPAAKARVVGAALALGFRVPAVG